MALILWKTFFVWYLSDLDQETYKKVLDENIYTCMELSKQSYEDILEMPVARFTTYLKWKSKLEEEKMKSLASMSNFGKRK